MRIRGIHYIGICTQRGSVFEGSPEEAYRIHPAPVLSRFHFVDDPRAKQTDDAFSPLPYLFREDYFDPVTRVRRGRVFSAMDFSQPKDWVVADAGLADLRASVIQYQRDYQTIAEKRTHVGSLPDVQLGSPPFVTIWRVVQVEVDSGGTPILMLKSYRSLGEVPPLRAAEIPGDVRTALMEALEAVENSANRQGPSDVVERCRNALSIILGQLAGDRSLDLQKAIDKLPKKGSKEELKAIAGRIVARLHSRGKANEEYKYKTRPLIDEDAQLALRCLGLVLRDCNWAD